MFPRGFNLFTKEPPRPLSHAEYFEQPLELASGLANADVVLASDGVRPLTNKGEVVLVRHPRALSPGTFGKLHGKLHKAKSRSSLNGMRWCDPHEQARTVSAATRRHRLLEGIFYKAPPKPSKADRDRLKRERELAELAANRAAATEAWNRLHAAAA